MIFKTLNETAAADTNRDDLDFFVPTPRPRRKDSSDDLVPDDGARV